MTTQLNYTSFDFATLKQNLITQLQNDPVLQDYNFAGSNLNTFIEIVCSVGDLLNFFINAMSNEGYIDSANLYFNVNRIAKLLGYHPQGPQAAQVIINMSTGNFTMVQDGDYFIIPAFSTMTATSTTPDGKPIKYLTTSDLSYIGFNGTTNNFNQTITLTQGIFIKNSTSAQYSGTGLPFQVYQLSDTMAIENYLQVFVDGVQWTYVNNLYTNLTSTSQVFTTRFNENQLVEVQFGDGIYGAVPDVGTNNIQINYIQTLADQGMIGANQLTGFDNSIVVMDALTNLPKQY